MMFYLGLTLHTLALAARLEVDQAGAGDFTDIQDAVDAAVPGDYVVVEPGVYAPVWMEGWVGPVVSSQGSLETHISTGAGSGGFHVENGAVGTSIVAGFTIKALSGETGVYLKGGDLTAWDLVIQDTSCGLFAYEGGRLEAEGVLVAGATSASLCAADAEIQASQVTLVDGYFHLHESGGGSVSVKQGIVFDATTVSLCNSGSVSLSYGLIAEYDGNPIESCMSADHVLLDYDPGFVSWSDDGDWSNDDYSLTETSSAIDAGDPACIEADGTTCDLGASGGERATAIDSDEDLLPDTWETAHGLDPDTPDNTEDFDEDGLDGLGEWLFGTDPNNRDSDADGADDLLELQFSLDPLDGSDQSPTASLVTDNKAGLIGVPVILDASGSTDPAGQDLTYTWSLVEKPEDSTLTARTLRNATPSLTPDAAGWWEVGVEVSDGTWTDATSTRFYVHSDTTISIPGDFDTLQEVSELLAHGLRLELGAGTHPGNVSLAADVVVVGQGIDSTTVKGWLQLAAGTHVQLSDITVTRPEETEHSGPLVDLEPGSWLDVRDVRIDGLDVTAVSTDQAVLTGWGLETLSELYGVHELQSVIRLGHARLAGEQNALWSDGGVVSLEGATATSYDNDPINLTNGLQVELRHVTAWSTANVYAIDAFNTPLTIHNVYLSTGRNTPISCSSQPDRVEAAYLGGGSMDRQSCNSQALPWIGDEVPLGSSGQLNLNSTGKQAGDFRDATAEGLRPDLGGHAGRLGLNTVLDMPDPDADEDEDGIRASTEWVLGTSDDQEDSDGDGSQDLAELLAGSDPADATDHFPQVEVLDGRTEAGQDVVLEVRWTTDPDLDDCDFSWEDGETENPRTERTAIAGTWTLDWTLTCGMGTATGSARLLVTEEIHVPGDSKTLAEALAAAEDHHRIVLQDGQYTGPIDLRGRWTELSGSGPDTLILGDLWTGKGAVSDLVVEGSLYANETDLTRVTVWGGEWFAHQGTHRAVLLDGGSAWLYDVDARNLTLDGPAYATGTLSTSAINGLLTADLTSNSLLFASSTHGLTSWSLGSEPFILEDPDPTLAILQPWPGSSLWDSGASDIFDPDGSVEDAGYTGGTEASPVDSDTDGLNDAWETLHGAFEPEGDPDGDALSNLGEWELGTDPNDADTDDDGLDDSLDPDPRDPGEFPVTARLMVDHETPAVGQTIHANAVASSAPGGQDLAFSWDLITPADATATLAQDGPAVTFAPDVPGTWWLSVTVQAGAYTDTATVSLHTYEEMLVPKDAELQDYINLAGSGAVLVLEENNYKGSLLVDKDLTLRAQGGTYSASIEGSESAPALRVTDGAHLNLEELTVWGESSQAAVEVWDNSRVHIQRVRMVGGDTSFRIYEGAIDAQSVFAIGASSVLDLVDGTFTVRNAVLGYPDSEAQSALVLRSGTVRMESTIFDWRNDDGDWLDFATCPSAPINCDFQLSMYRSLAPGGEEALPTLQYLLDVGFEEPEFLLSPPDASYMAGSDLRLDHDSPAQDAGVDHDPDADGSMNDMGVFGGRLGNWKDVDNDRDGFSELEGDCDDTDPEVLGDPRRTCEESPGCASTPPGSSVLWLAGLLGLSARRRPR